MKKFIKAAAAFLLLAVISSLFTYFLKDSACQFCYKKTAVITYKTEQKQITDINLKSSPWFITDDKNNHIYGFQDKLLTNKQNDKILFPKSIDSINNAIFNYLKEHQDKELVIEAKYLMSEGKQTGLNRAEHLKTELQRFGINESRIKTKAILAEYSYNTDGKYDEGVILSFKNVTSDDIALIEKSITNKLLYTDFGSTKFKADKTLEGYATELRLYLKKYPEKTVHVTGHTDNIGKANSNYQLGLKRAKAVMTYLISQNIDKNKIEVHSKGESEPVADNSTEEGKKLNRRIEITVK